MGGQVLEATSAQMGSGPWEVIKRKDLVMGKLLAIDLDGKRALSFRSDSGEVFSAAASHIMTVQKVASGFNVILDVVFGDGPKIEGIACFVGPRGRMKTIFATLGHPI